MDLAREHHVSLEAQLSHGRHQACLVWCDGNASETVIARYFDPQLGRFLTQDSYLGQIDEPPSLHRYFYGYANPLRYIDPTGHIARQMLDESINKSTDSSSNWFTAGAKAFLKEASYQTLDVISFGALHRQDKLVDQNLSGQITDAEYQTRTGVNVALSAGQAALTLGTGGAAGTSAATAVAWGAASGIAGQGISDIGELYGTQTKSIDDVKATDYLLAGAFGAVGGYAGYKARGPIRAGPSQAEKAGVIAEHASASPADVNVKQAIKPPAQEPPTVATAGASGRSSTYAGRQRFDASGLTSEQVDSAILKSIRRKSGATGTPSGRIAATADQSEFILQKTTAWRRNVHANDPGYAALGSLSPELKGTYLHSSVQSRTRQLGIEGMSVNERLYGTSPYKSPTTGLPYEYRVPDFRLGQKGGTIFDIKPRGTPMSGPQYNDFRNMGETTDIRWIAYDPY